jgi:hypothetical protein
MRVDYVCLPARGRDAKEGKLSMCSDLGSPCRHPQEQSLRVETAIGEDKQLIDIANRENTMYGEALGMWVIVTFVLLLVFSIH